MRALVTGGAGCIGAELTEALLRDGCEVTVIDNLSSGRIEHIQELFSNSCFRFIEGDLLERGTLDRAMQRIEMVFHLAANSDVRFTPGGTTDEDLRQNTIATYNVLESMRCHDVRRLAFASTSAIYGIHELRPIPENLAPRPISLYGATKLGCEALISAFSHLFGMQCWIFRFANIVGSKVRKKGRTVISDFIHRLREDPRRLTILGNGRQAKSYMHASACIEAMRYVIAHAHEPLNIYNLGCSDSVSVTRIADMVVKAMGLSGVEYCYTGGEGGWPGDVPRFMLDVTALNSLGWHAHHNSEQAVAIAIDELVHRFDSTETAVGGPACKP